MAYETEVMRYQRELGTAHAMYYLALSYNKRAVLGEDDALLLKSLQRQSI
jgi:hypothetical protein